MRVIGGSARGRSLRSPVSRGVRPTSDRVREAIFDVLGHLDGADAVVDATVLDLYSGSGALGIEALSRGAAAVTFVESDRAAIEVIRANLASTGLSGRATVVRADALAFVARAPAPVDVALADPPYAFSAWSELLIGLRAELCVLESDRAIELPERFVEHRVYRYGTTLVTVAHAREAVAEGHQVHREGGEAR